MADPQAQLTELLAHLRATAGRHRADEAVWWAVNGYANLVEIALLEIRRHERRARIVDGDRAPRFSECGEL